MMNPYSEKQYPWEMDLPRVGASPRPRASDQPSGHSDWSGTFALGVIVFAGVGGYFIYRNLVASAGPLRGAKRYFERREG